MHILIPLLTLFAAGFVGLFTASSPIMMVLILGTLMAIFGVVLKPSLMVYLFIFGGFFDSLDVALGGIMLSVADVTSLGIVGACVLHLLLKNISLTLPRGFAWLLFHWVWAGLSYFFVDSPQDVMGHFLRFSSRIMAIFALVCLVDNIRIAQRCLYLVCLAGLVHAAVGLIIDGGSGGRITGLVNQPNIFSTLLAMGFLPLISLWTIHKTTSKKTIAAFGAALLAMVIILAGSRTTFVGLMLALLWFTRSSIKVSLVVLVCCVFGYQAANVFSEESVETVQSRMTLQDTSVRQRKDIFKTAPEVIVKFPLMGTGYGHFSRSYQMMNVESNRGRASHSYYLGVAASMGLPALFAILIFFGMQAKILFATMRRYLALGEAFKTNWVLCNTVSVLFIFQMANLLGRGSQKHDWTIFAMYAAAAALFERQHVDDKARLQSAASPSTARTSSEGSLLSNKLV